MHEKKALPIQQSLYRIAQGRRKIFINRRIMKKHWRKLWKDTDLKEWEKPWRIRGTSRSRELKEKGGKRKEGIGKRWKFKIRAYSGLIKRRVERERIEEGKIRKFHICAYVGTEKEKGWKRKEGIGKDMKISDTRTEKEKGW
jgi:hypothetical protein